MEEMCWIHNERFPEDGHCSECHRIQVICQEACNDYEDPPEEKQGFSFLILVICGVLGLILGWFLAIMASRMF